MNLREDVVHEELPDWVSKLTTNMERNFAKTGPRSPRALDKAVHTANSGRIYVEQLHLHPVRLGLTFTQEWIDLNAGADTVMVFQFIRGMVRTRIFLWKRELVLKARFLTAPFLFQIYRTAGLNCQRTSRLHLVRCWSRI